MFAGVQTLATMVGKTPRRVTADLTRLIALGILIPVSKRTGGSKQTTHYRLDLAALKAANTDTSVIVPPVINPDTGSGVSDVFEPRHQRHETLTPATETLTLVTENPDSSVTRSTSNNQDQPENKKATAPPFRFSQGEDPKDNFKIIRKLVHEVLDRPDAYLLGIGELAEETKTLCGARHIAYDGDVIARATAAVCSYRRVIEGETLKRHRA